MFSPEAPGQEGIGMSRLNVPQTEALVQLVQSLNLPADSLSTALVAFARHFSLPLDPALLTKLRREVLPFKTSREAVALAAAAAMDKGVTLTPEALEKYAAAIDPNARREQKGGQDGTGGDGSERKDRKFECFGETWQDVSQDGLGKIRDDIDENDPLLAILNSIPGKDEKRWMVYPFQVSAGGKRFMVSVRVMTGIGKEDARLAVDVAGEEGRWLFVVNRQGSDPDNSAETQVFIWPLPEPHKREVLKREIQEVLGPLGGRVILRDGESFLAECRNDALPSINKEI
jgi:hypothetical protein